MNETLLLTERFQPNAGSSPKPGKRPWRGGSIEEGYRLVYPEELRVDLVCIRPMLGASRELWEMALHSTEPVMLECYPKPLEHDDDSLFRRLLLLDYDYPDYPNLGCSALTYFNPELVGFTLEKIEGWPSLARVDEYGLKPSHWNLLHSSVGGCDLDGAWDPITRRWVSWIRHHHEGYLTGKERDKTEFYDLVKLFSFSLLGSH